MMLSKDNSAPKISINLISSFSLISIRRLLLYNIYFTCKNITSLMYDDIKSLTIPKHSFANIASLQVLALSNGP